MKQLQRFTVENISTDKHDEWQTFFCVPQCPCTVLGFITYVLIEQPGLYIIHVCHLRYEMLSAVAVALSLFFSIVMSISTVRVEFKPNSAESNSASQNQLSLIQILKS